MSKTDGIGTWVWNSYVGMLGSYFGYYGNTDKSHYEYFDFTCNGVAYTYMYFTFDHNDPEDIIRYGNTNDLVVAYDAKNGGGWQNEIYRTIHFDVAPPSNVLSVLQVYAVYQEPPKLTDLTGTTWKWKNSFAIPSTTFDITYNVNFISEDGTSFKALNPVGYANEGFELYYFFTKPPISGGSTTDLAYFEYLNTDPPTWQNEAYRIISITGGTDATNVELINYLYANAELQGSAPVTDKYKLIDQNGNLIEINSMKKGIVVYQGKEYEFDNN